MTIYVVLAPPTEADSAEPEPDRFVFVKEGFCWPAFFLTIPWLIWRRLWLVLIVYVPALIAVFAITGRAPPLVESMILVLFAVLVGLEANNLRRWTLERRGYRFLGAAAGERLREAEYRFFVGWAAPSGPPDGSAEPTSPAPKAPARVEVGEVIGMFPTPGARP